jgi:hypothetical protein
MKKFVLATALAAVLATPAFAQPFHHHATPAERHGLQAAPPAIMYKGMPYTDPDEMIRNYLIRTYREEGTG